MHWFELMLIELGRFDPDLLPYQFVWNMDISDTVQCNISGKQSLN